MKRKAHCLLIALASLLLSGCAYFQAMGPDAPKKVDDLVNAGQYGKALDILEYSNPNNANYEQLQIQQKEVMRLAAQLEKETLDQTQQLTQAGEWYKAAQLFKQRLDRLPKSTKLQKQHHLFQQTRDKLLTCLERKLDINRARWLIANGPVQQEMIRVLPDAETKFAELKDFRAQKEKTADHLLKFTIQSLDQQDHQSAAKMIALIDSLAVNNLNEEMLVMCRYRLQEQQKIQRGKDELRKHQADKRKQRLEHLRQEKEKQRTAELLELLKTDTSLAALQKTWNHLRVTTNKKQTYHLALKNYRALEQQYQHGIKRQSQIGRELYSQGKIHQALKIWQSLLAMDKNNQNIQGYIDRANRVLNKLNRLQQEESKYHVPASP